MKMNCLMTISPLKIRYLSFDAFVFRQVCLKKCPDKEFHASNYIRSNSRSLPLEDLICLPNVTVTSKADLKDAVDKNKCAKWYMKTIAGKF